MTGDHVARMRPGAVLLHVARAEIRDWSSVAPALAGRQDVTLGADGIGLSRIGMPEVMAGRCLLSPHVAGVTDGAPRAMQDHVVDGVVRCMG